MCLVCQPCWTCGGWFIVYSLTVAQWRLFYFFLSVFLTICPSGLATSCTLQIPRIVLVKSENFYSFSENFHGASKQWKLEESFTNSFNLQSAFLRLPGNTTSSYTWWRFSEWFVRKKDELSTQKVTKIERIIGKYKIIIQKFCQKNKEEKNFFVTEYRESLEEKSL